MGFVASERCATDPNGARVIGTALAVVVLNMLRRKTQSKKVQAEIFQEAIGAYLSRTVSNGVDPTDIVAGKVLAMDSSRPVGAGTDPPLLALGDAAFAVFRFLRGEDVRFDAIHALISLGNAYVKATYRSKSPYPFAGNELRHVVRVLIADNDRYGRGYDWTNVRLGLAKYFASPDPKSGDPDVAAISREIEDTVRARSEKDLRPAVSKSALRAWIRRIAYDLLSRRSPGTFAYWGDANLRFEDGYLPIGFQETALLLLQEALESFASNFFVDCELSAAHDGRTTVVERDVVLMRNFYVRRLMGTDRIDA